jgi:hypothetical protein
MKQLSDNQVAVIKQIADEYATAAKLAKEWMNIVQTAPSIENYQKAQSELHVAQRFMLQLGL